MDYNQLKTLGDRALDVSQRFYAECEQNGTKATVNKYYESEEIADLEEMLLIGAWRANSMMVVKGTFEEGASNMPLSASHPFIRANAILFVDFLVKRQGEYSEDGYPFILGAFCAVRPDGVTGYIFDVVWYLSNKQVSVTTFPLDCVTGQNGMTFVMLSPNGTNANLNAVLFAWSSYCKAAQNAFASAPMQSQPYIQ